VVICLERGADLHMVQLMPLPLTVSCFSKIQIGFTFQILAHPGSPRKRAVKRVCVCMCVIGVVAAIQSVTTTTMNKLFCIKADLSVCVCLRVCCSVPCAVHGHSF